jgi:hypothetical protein
LGSLGWVRESVDGFEKLFGVVLLVINKHAVVECLCLRQSLLVVPDMVFVGLMMYGEARCLKSPLKPAACCLPEAELKLKPGRWA